MQEKISYLDKKKESYTTKQCIMYLEIDIEILKEKKKKCKALIQKLEEKIEDAHKELEDFVIKADIRGNKNVKENMKSLKIAYDLLMSKKETEYALEDAKIEKKEVSKKLKERKELKKNLKKDLKNQQAVLEEEKKVKSIPPLKEPQSKPMLKQPKEKMPLVPSKKRQTVTKEQAPLQKLEAPEKLKTNIFDDFKEDPDFTIYYDS